MAVFVSDYGRPHGMADEVEFRGVDVYAARDGKIAHVEHFTDRSDATEAVGLATA